MEDSESSDLDTADDFNTSMSLGTTTDGGFDDIFMLEDELGSQPAAVEVNPQDDENRRKTRFGGQKHYFLCYPGRGEWRNIVIAKLAKSNNFFGRRINSSDLKDTVMDLRKNGIYKNKEQIQRVLRELRGHMKKAKGPPKFVRTEDEMEAFNVVAAKVLNSQEGSDQKKRNRNRKRKNMPPAPVKPSSPSDSDVLASLSKKVDKINEDFAVFRTDVLKALSKVNEPTRGEKTIEFSEGKVGEVPDGLQALLHLRNSTVKSTKTRNEYVLQNFIGSGTFSVVFRAVEKIHKTAVAMKIMTSQEEAIEERNFLNVLLTSGRKCNEYCCFPSDTFEFLHKGKIVYCFIMDLLRKDLFTMIFDENMKFSLHSIVQILAQTFSALSFINSIGFIHSDIKPENIMIADYNLRKIGEKEVVVEPRVKIIDANAMFLLGEPFADCQTARYRCPEVLLGIDFNENIDTWSMGVIAIEMITGDFLFDFEYDATEHAKAAPQVHMIEKVIGPLPKRLWDNCRFDDLKNAMDNKPHDAATLKDILTDFSSDGYGIVLNTVLPSLLKTDPNERPKPEAVSKQLTEFLPIT